MVPTTWMAPIFWKPEEDALSNGLQAVVMAVQTAPTQHISLNLP